MRIYILLLVANINVTQLFKGNTVSVMVIFCTVRILLRRYNKSPLFITYRSERASPSFGPNGVEQEGLKSKTGTYPPQEGH